MSFSVSKTKKSLKFRTPNAATKTEEENNKKKHTENLLKKERKKSETKQN